MIIIGITTLKVKLTRLHFPKMTSSDEIFHSFLFLFFNELNPLFQNFFILSLPVKKTGQEGHQTVEVGSVVECDGKTCVIDRKNRLKGKRRSTLVYVCVEKI